LCRRGGCLSELEPSPFDALAGEYDDTFTESAIGSTMREAVWIRMGELWPPGSRVVELNCGTGVDAAWLGQRGVRAGAGVQLDDAAPGRPAVPDQNHVVCCRRN